MNHGLSICSVLNGSSDRTVDTSLTRPDLLFSAPRLGAPLSRDFKDYSAQIHKETPPCECVIILAAKKKYSKVTKKLLTS